MWTYNYEGYSDVLEHHGIPGMKHGIRRYQNKDGSLTPAGRQRYYKEALGRDKAKADKHLAKANKYQTKSYHQESEREFMLEEGGHSKRKIEKTAIKQTKLEEKAQKERDKAEAILNGEGRNAMKAKKQIAKAYQKEIRGLEKEGAKNYAMAVEHRAAKKSFDNKATKMEGNLRKYSAMKQDAKLSGNDRKAKQYDKKFDKEYNKQTKVIDKHNVSDKHMREYMKKMNDIDKQIDKKRSEVNKDSGMVSYTTQGHYYSGSGSQYRRYKDSKARFIDPDASYRDVSYDRTSVKANTKKNKYKAIKKGNTRRGRSHTNVRVETQYVYI